MKDKKFSFILIFITMFLMGSAEKFSFAHLTRADSRYLEGFQFAQLDKKTGQQLGGFFPAKVPGDVISDLVRVGKIKHPYFDFNSKEVLWVNNYDWLYQVELPRSGEKSKRQFVLFRGIDYQSEVYFNNYLLGKHTGMFSTVLLELTNFWRKDEPNILSVKLTGQKPKQGVANIPILGTELERKKTLKQQMSYGWDFAPRLVGAGIWDRVEYFETDEVMIRDIQIRAKNSGELKIELLLDSLRAVQAVVELNISSANFEGFEQNEEFNIKIDKGISEQTIQTKIKNPKLWWTRDLGDPNLYLVSLAIKLEQEPSGKQGSKRKDKFERKQCECKECGYSDCVSEAFGFREISWEANPEMKDKSSGWVLYLNGKRLFIRGANWVPPEALHGQLSVERYKKLIEMSRSAHINLFRVWGGGNRERDEFYSLCDENGILVWQEFPLACVTITRYPDSLEFLNLVKNEVREIVRRIRNHPCILLYSAGNEISPWRNPELVNVIEREVNSLDPGIRFIPGSPAKGDSHNWLVWHAKANLEAYYSDERFLISEFGLQAFPSKETLERYISYKLIWPIGSVHKHHNLGPAKMNKYVSVLKPKNDLDSYIEASQLMQAHYLQHGIEYWRMNKYRVSGTIFWQLNEPWPAISWSLIDYDLKPKLAFYMLKDTYNPVLVSAKYEDREWAQGDEFRAEIYIVNDLHKEFSDIDFQAFISDKKVSEFKTTIPPDSVIKIAEIKTKLETQMPTLELFLKRDEEAISHNFYRLWIYDPVKANPLYLWLYKNAQDLMWREKTTSSEINTN